MDLLQQIFKQKNDDESNQSPNMPNEQLKSSNDETPSIKKVDSNVKIRTTDLEMDYEDMDSQKDQTRAENKKRRSKGPRTPNDEYKGDFGGCIVGISNDFTSQLNELSNSFNTMFDSSKENKNDKNSEDLHNLKTKSVDEPTEACWTSRPGTPERKD